MFDCIIYMTVYNVLPMSRHIYVYTELPAAKPSSALCVTWAPFCYFMLCNSSFWSWKSNIHTGCFLLLGDWILSIVYESVGCHILHNCNIHFFGNCFTSERFIASKHHTSEKTYVTIYLEQNRNSVEFSIDY